MSKDLPYIIPSPQIAIDETFANQQITYQFYREVETRSEFQEYCQWYHQTAAENRRELEKMRGELDIWQWFRRQ